MADKPQINIMRVLDLAGRMTVIAEEGEVDCRDDSCAVLYGLVRDCAYKIRRRAEVERDNHMARGRWDGGTRDANGR